MKNLKLVVIGAGSSYTPELIEGVINNHSSLPFNKISFVDVEMGKEKMSIIFKLTQRMLKKAGLNIELSQGFDKREALKGADFVITQLRVGGVDARIVDENLPKSIGIIGQETNGAGGLFKALRTIPVIIDIANDMKEICPDAWLINFTNPASMVTEAIHKYSNNNKVVGLCNGPINMSYKVAELLNVDIDDLYIEYKGSNHMNFITRILCQGKDRIAEVIDMMNKSTTDEMGFKNINNEQFNPDLLNSNMLIPSSYLKYYLKTKELIEEQNNSDLTRGEVVKSIESDLFEKYKDETLEEKPKELSERGGSLYSTAALNVIRSIYNNDRSIQTVNVINNGAITNLPYNTVVEVNCVITSSGPIPICAGEIPSPAKGIVSHMKDYEAQVVEAAATGNYNKLISAFVYNPLCTSDNKGIELVNAMLKANKEYLPQFKTIIDNL